VKESETEKYFEFATTDTAYRVYKPSWVEWVRPDEKRLPLGSIAMSQIENRAREKRSGRPADQPVAYLKKKWRTAEGVKDFGDYTSYVLGGIGGICGSGILRSALYEEQERFVHLLYKTEASHGDWGVSDRLSLGLIVFQTSKAEGRVTGCYKTLKEIRGRRNPNPWERM
jgi:hypothetical protein